jgi:hypothetical protein
MHVPVQIVLNPKEIALSGVRLGKSAHFAEKVSAPLKIGCCRFVEEIRF